MKKFTVLALAVILGLCFSQPSRAAMDQGDKKFEVTGEVRFRGDYTDNATDLNSDALVDDSGVVWPWRVRAAIHGQFSRNVSAHVEFQSFGFGGDTSQIFPTNGSSNADIATILGNDSSNTQLYQGWLELGDIGGSSFDLRMGRQELVYGSEMLVGDADFYNGVVHDGFRGAWQYKKWTLDVWDTKLIDNVGFGPAIFPTSNGPNDTNFYGAYATFKPLKKLGFDAYGLVLQDATDEHRWTYGGRVYSKWDSNWTWEAEAALQTGEFEASSVDIRANGFEGELGYQWRKSKIRPRVYGRYSHYSGNDTSTTGKDESFDPLFQDFHARNGYMDLVRATNLNTLRAGVSWNGKDDRHVFGVDVLKFDLDQDVGSESDLGSELDLYYKYAYTKNVNITAAIASFQPGKLFDTPFTPGAVMPDVTGTKDDSAMRVYVNTRLRF